MQEASEAPMTEEAPPMVQGAQLPNEVHDEVTLFSFFLPFQWSIFNQYSDKRVLENGGQGKTEVYQENPILR